METKRSNYDRMWAWFLTIAMIFSMVPASVFAIEPRTTDTDNPHGITISPSINTLSDGDTVATLNGNLDKSGVPSDVTEFVTEKWEWKEVDTSYVTFTNSDKETATATIPTVTENTTVKFSVSYEFTYLYENDLKIAEGTLTDTVSVTFEPKKEYVLTLAGSQANPGDYTAALQGKATYGGESHTSGVWLWSATDSSFDDRTSATPRATITNFSADKTVTFTAKYYVDDVMVATEEVNVTFVYKTFLQVEYDGKTYTENFTINAKVGDDAYTIVASSDTGSVTWADDRSPAISYPSGTGSNTLTFTPVAVGTATLTLTHPSESSLKYTITINVTQDAYITLPSSAENGYTFTGTAAATLKIDTNQKITVTSDTKEVVTVSEDSSLSTGSAAFIVLTPKANGTAKITIKTTGVARSTTETSFNVTVSTFATVEPEPEVEEEEEEDTTTPTVEKKYIPILTFSGDSSDIVLAARGNYADRKIIVTAQQTNADEAGSASSAELTAAADKFNNQLKWQMTTGTNLVEMGAVANGKRFTYAEPGYAECTYWVDLDNNGELDDNEKSYSGVVKITNTGIVVSNTDVKMATYENADTIYVYSYGDVGSIVAASQNTSLVTVEQTTNTGTVDAALALILSSTSEVGTTNVILTYTGGSETISVSVTDAVAGTIVISEDDGINANSPLYFKDIIDRINDEAQVVYAGESLVRVQSLFVEAEEGILYVGYQDPDHTGGAVGTSISYYIGGTPSFEDVVFVPYASYTGKFATITYTGYTSSGRSFYGEIVVYLTEINDVMVVTDAQTPVTLQSSEFNSIAQATMSQNLASLVFSLPDTNEAIFYYDYTSPTNYHHKIQPGEELTLAQLDNVTIVPSPGFGTPPQNGTYTDLHVAYTATGTNKMVKTAIFVLRVYPHDSGEAVVYNTRQGEYLTLVTADFHANSQANTGNYNAAGDFEGANMSYLTFTLPSTAEGVLYEDYRSEYDYRRTVVADTPYYASYREPQIAEVSFVPAEGFTGAVNIPFVGYDVNGSSYKGTLQINVTSHQEQDINYICTAGSYVSLYAEDFNQLSRNLVGNNLESITFTGAPAAYQGELRMGQGPDGTEGVAVFTGVSFFRSSSPYIDKLSFSSADGFSGTVEIPFDGKSTTGQVFSAVMSITVANQNVVTIPYSGTHYYPVTFIEDDFEKYSLLRTESELAYVRFEIPEASQGTLYYDYVSLDDYESLVSIDDNFFAEDSQYINKVTFVPHVDFVGTTYVNFTAWGTNGQSFKGNISINVAESGDPLQYTIHSGEYVYLNASAMNIFCRDQTGYNLDYISLSMPAETEGNLYHTHSPYTNESEWVSASSSTYYYRLEDRNINDLAFVSDNYFIGTVELPFVGVSEEGTTCSGTIKITVLPLEAQTTVEYYTSFSPVVFKSADIAAVWNDTLIDYIILHNLPTEAEGKLYYENNLSSFATLDAVYYGYDPSRGYSIDTLIYVPAASFSGAVTLGYTAYTVGGTEFLGEIIINVMNQQVSQNFVDMVSYDWAIASADYLYTTGVSIGIGGYRFGPELNITRGDYALMLQKAFRFLDQSATPFADVSDTSYYYGAITTMRALDIATGDDNNCYHPDSPISRQDAMIMLSRAMVAAGKSVPSTDISVLYRFRDVTDVYTYAAPELSRMVQAEIVAGDDNNCLNPKALMTRAEMAVILHKAMTY